MPIMETNKQALIHLAAANTHEQIRIAFANQQYYSRFSAQVKLDDTQDNLISDPRQEALILNDEHNLGIH